ncbi:MAG: acetate/propionate family kinase [Acidobacteriaceae bacterium]
MEVAPKIRTDLQHLPILVFNGGSSSIKFSIYAADDMALTLLYHGAASGIGTPKAQFTFYAIQDGKRQTLVSESAPPELDSYRDSVRKIAALLQQSGLTRPAAIGHRIVHTGPKLHAHQLITPEVLSEIEKATCFAPLHQPIGLEIIREAKESFPGVDNYACFDTIFDQDLPEVASIYPLPKEIRDQGVHRYGFHGLSCESILQQFQDGRVPDLFPPGQVPKRLIYAHLGSGASVTAIRDGKALDVSLGFTPCGGLVMGTRPGDLDPGLIFYLLRLEAGSAANATDAVEQMLNNQSGMLALSGLSNDMRILRDAANHGNAQAALAIEVFVLSAKKTIGGYTALMGGLDALVFSGGIGERDPITRAQICAGLDAFGLTLNPEENEPTHAGPRTISWQGSSVAVYVLPADEDRVIAGHVARLVAGK